jgi:hypothetical protein
MLRVLTPDEVIRYGLDKVNWIKVEPPTQPDYNPTDMELTVYNANVRYLNGEFK